MTRGDRAAASSDVLLEICLDSEASARAAQEGGAHRVELCDRLDLGGTTPPESLVRSVRRAIAMSLSVMVRPRGGDFCYTQAEAASMEADIAMAKRCGADGIVLGMLREDGSVDTELLRFLAARARPLAVTFHRAFDAAAAPYEALEEIIAGGAVRLLTSGQQRTAQEGADMLGELVRRARGRISVMPGAGIHKGNAADILRQTGARELHVGTGVRRTPSGTVDPELVRELAAALAPLGPL